MPDTASLRVFLFSNASPLLPLLSKLEEALRDSPLYTYEPFLVARQSILSGHSSTAGREMQEGDLLITVGVPGRGDHTLRAVHDEALARKLIVFPFLLAQDPANLGDETKALVDPRLASTVLKAGLGLDAVVKAMTAHLHERALFGSPDTDLLLRPQFDKAPRNPFRARALDLLERDGAAATSELQKSAHETRQQAGTAIRARLYELALETLQRAAEFDATSAITAYWMARVRLAQNTQSALLDALRDATRAARIAALQGVKTTLEVASYRLAARICAMLGDFSGMQGHLASAARHEPDQLDLKIENLRLLNRIGHRKESLKVLETLYANDRTALSAVAQDPELKPFHAHLQGLRQRREEALRKVFDAIFAGEKRLREVRHEPPGKALEDWDESSLEALEELEKRTTQSLEKQLEMLNQWGTALIAKTRTVHTLRAQQRSLLEASRTMPTRTEYDFLLEKIWPRIGQRFGHLPDALQRTDGRKEELAAAEVEATRELREEAATFTSFAEAFEALLVRHAQLLHLPDAHHQSLRSGLTVLTSRTEERPHYDGLLPEDLCAIIAFPATTEAPREGLYRLERDSQGREGASRVGVYFVEAKRKFG